MSEIFRFHQVRSVQKLTLEEQTEIGIPMYQHSLSKFALALQSTQDDRDKFLKLVTELQRSWERNYHINELKDIHPLPLRLYEWFDYKSKPIMLEQFKQFLLNEFSQEVQSVEGFSLNEEWEKISDNYLLRIVTSLANTNDFVDFQLLLKVCFILSKFKSTLELVNQPSNTRTDNSSTIAIEEDIKRHEETVISRITSILTMPVITPPNIFNYRCGTYATKLLSNFIPESVLDHSSDILRERPGHDHDKCECNAKPQKPSHHCICVKPYIADLLIVKEELSRYEEGDIAAIENILAGETKTRTHQTLLRTDRFTEEEIETTSSEERDHQVTVQHALQREANEEINSRLNVDAGVILNSKLGPNTTIEATANVAGEYSKNESSSSSRSFAKEIVDKAVYKIQEKTRLLKSTRVINEVQEENIHAIDNTQQDHRAGIYYWVNKISKAQVFNYGKRMMIDVYIPEPAAVYKKLYELNSKNEEDQHPPPEKPNIKTSDILRDTYIDILLEYGISGAQAPPNESTSIHFSFEHAHSEQDKHITQGFSETIQSEMIPPDYQSKKLIYDVICTTAHPELTTKTKDEVHVTVAVGSEIILSAGFNQTGDESESNKEWQETDEINLSGVEGKISLSIAGYSNLSLSIAGSMVIECSLKDEVFEKWQVSIYDLIMDDYLNKLSDYEIQQEIDSELDITGRNPLLNREIERNELKRHIIAILMCNYFNGIGSMMDNVVDCGYPEIDFAKLEKDAPVIRFFEQVFEWKYVTYLFYSSMWARKCKWEEMFEEDSGDPLFDKFLTAGAVRVQVPVRENMNAVMRWYLLTGQIWGASGEPPIYGDDEYVAIIQEIKEARQGDYSEREGEIRATANPNEIQLTNSLYYWDVLNNVESNLNIKNDIDREIVIDFEVYRIVDITQVQSSDPSTWNILLDQPFKGANGQSYKHSVGALFVGAPWEVVIPTKLVYLRNTQDTLPTYPLK